MTHTPHQDLFAWDRLKRSQIALASGAIFRHKAHFIQRVPPSSNGLQTAPSSHGISVQSFLTGQFQINSSPTRTRNIMGPWPGTSPIKLVRYWGRKGICRCERVRPTRPGACSTVQHYEREKLGAGCEVFVDLLREADGDTCGETG